MIGLLAFSFVFGGASREHAVRLAMVELAALPLLVLGLSQFNSAELIRRHRTVLLLAAAIAAVPLLQLVPLPPGVWTRLPGREPLVLALQLIGEPLGWIPLSLTPDKTWNAFLALIPPIAVFIALVVRREGSLARIAILTLLTFAFVNVAAAALQLASGDRRFYPYETTTAGFIAGLFANRNHFTTLLLTAMPFGAALAGERVARRPDQLRLYVMLLAGGFAVVMLAVLAAQSRAGVLLFAPTLLLSILLAARSARLRRPPRIVWAIGALLLLGGGAVTTVFLPSVLERFESGDQVEARFQRWPIVIEAGQSYLPVGSGLGSFDPVFRTVEPLEQLDATFFNQAHNEYLEVWLETGWVGVGLILLVLVWWVKRSREVWFSIPGGGAPLQRAASIAILVILIHSAVDYPLRTETIAVVFAMAAAILEGGWDVAGTRTRRVRRVSSDHLEPQA